MTLRSNTGELPVVRKLAFLSVCCLASFLWAREAEELPAPGGGAPSLVWLDGGVLKQDSTGLFYALLPDSDNQTHGVFHRAAVYTPVATYANLRRELQRLVDKPILFRGVLARDTKGREAVFITDLSENLTAVVQ